MIPSTFGIFETKIIGFSWCRILGLGFVTHLNAPKFLIKTSLDSAHGHALECLFPLGTAVSPTTSAARDRKFPNKLE